MTWIRCMLQITDVILRVPPMFVIDSILNRTFLLAWLPDDVTVFSLAFLARVLVLQICFVTAFIIFLLPTKELLNVYSYLLSGMVLWFSHYFNHHYIETEISSPVQPQSFWDIITNNAGGLLVNVSVQITMAFCYNNFRKDASGTPSVGGIQGFMDRLRSATYLCMLQPIIARLLSMPTALLKRLPLFAALLIGTEFQVALLINSRSVISWFKETYRDTKQHVQMHGILFFGESNWIRLHVPSVLRVFWICRTAYQLTYLVAVAFITNSEEGTDWYLSVDDVIDIARQLLMSGCETLTALLGMSSIVAYITHYIGILMTIYVGSDNEEDKNMGTVSAVLFFILALQTGLTALEPEKRLQRLYRNVCLLSTAILHFVHSMVSPLLMNLSASGNMSALRHLRPLSACVFLVVFPCWFLYYLWCMHTVSTWLLAVTAFSIEVVIKVIISLFVYALFMIDAHRDSFWERLDDYVYYIKSAGNTIEFLFGIFLFCNGGFIMLFESGGTIRAIMMCIHAYYNIWVQAKEGWKVFMNRRAAVSKINSLPIATEEQLLQHSDVCSICYQDLDPLSTRVTHCRHLFHSVCLRKWLYIRDNCPMCHSLIYKTENGVDGAQANGEVVHEHLD